MTVIMTRRRFVHFPDLATFLDETGITQKDLARAVETSQAHISRILSGDVMPRPELAFRLAKFAHVPLDSFLRQHLRKKRTTATAVDEVA